MTDYPGRFYLGTEYDPGAPQHTGAPFMLSRRDMLSGAACLGAAGKDSPGVCIVEEALLQAIPALIVDTSGDLAASLSNGCESDLPAPGSMDRGRALALADRAIFQVYTPGAAGGLPVNVWQSLNPPTLASGLNWTRHADA
ncbi:MAG TPA: hypothetical protein VGK81_02585, partial [Anaerolineae bacterium]